MSLPSHFSSYRSSTVLDHVKRWKVTSICCYAHSVLVACSDGALRQFEGDEEKVVWRESVLSDDFGGSKKPVDQMTAIAVRFPPSSARAAAPSAPGDDALLLSIVSGVCRVHTLPSLRSLSILADSKGCYAFAVSAQSYLLPPTPSPPSAASSRQSSSSSSGAPLLLALANKRKQLLFYHYTSFSSSPTSLNGDFTLSSTVPVDDVVRCMTWCASSLVVGIGREYTLIPYDAPRDKVRLFDCGKKAATPVAALVDGKDAVEVVLVQDTRGICIAADGSPSRKEGLTFSDIPSMLLSSPPYLLALLPSSIEIRQTRSGLLTQTVAIKDGGRWMEKQLDTVFVAGGGYVRCLYPIPLRELVDDCMKRSQYREALSLVQLSDDMQWRSAEEREERLNDVYTLYAYDLFNHGDYQQAMMLFQQSHCDPVHIISLFPDVLPSHAAPLLHSMHIASIKHPVRVTSAQGEQALLKALAALIPYLANMQNKIRLQQQQGGGGLDDGGRRGVAALKVDVTSLASLIDTVLLKAYLLSDIPLLPFLQQPNACDVDECSAILRAYEKYPELVCLYQQHDEHREALDLLTSIGRASFTATAASPLRPSQLVLAGLSPTITYLQSLLKESGRRKADHEKDDPFALVTEFSRWIFERDADSALTIFTREHDDDGRSSASPQAVFDFLRSVTDREHCIAYLESLIDRTGEVHSVLHNELVFLYLDSVLRLMRAEERGSAKGSQDTSASDSGVVTPVDRRKSSGSRRTSASLAATSVSSALAPKDAALLLSLRRRLLAFLRRSHHYNPERLLSKFPRHHLLEERCILLSRINQHEEALGILAHQLKDPDAAERYCVQVYNARQGAGAEVKEGEGNDLFLLLLHVYLKGSGTSGGAGGDDEKKSTSASSSSPPPAMLDAAVRLLTNHFRHINPVKALELIPPSTAIHSLQPYLLRVLRAQKHARRAGEVVKQLQKAEHLHTKLDWMEARGEGVLIEDGVVCARCGKRIGTASFARYPDGSVMHYLCHKLQLAAPGAGGIVGG